jgi:Holliday junction resolvase RusA-like endonuclease
MIWPLVIELAGEPVGQGRPRFVRATGRAYTPAHTAKYAAAVRVAASDAMAGENPIEGAIALTVVASVPVPASWSGKKQRAAIAGAIRPASRPDASNYLKMAEDALNQVAWRDDAQVVDARIVKVYSARPALRIEIAPIVLPVVEEPAGRSSDAIDAQAAQGALL